MSVRGARAVEWKDGSLDELLAMLSGPALAARIEVLVAEGRNERPAGEVHVVAGGVAEASAGRFSGDEALEHLRKILASGFRVEPALPDPATGALVPAGPEQGSLSERPLAALMRYCEEYVMTCLLEVQRGGERAAIAYRRGEIVTTTVDGSDAPERLPEVMTWTEGHYRISLPPLMLPAAQPPTRRDTITLIPTKEPEARRGTVPGMPVDVFDETGPDRVTAVGVPTPPAIAASAPPPTHTPSPAAAAASPPAAAHAPAPRAGLPARAPSPTPGFGSAAKAARTPSAPHTPVLRPQTPAPRQVARRAGVRRRSASDLPIALHVMMGLGLGLAIVGGYWVVQSLLMR